MYSDEETGSPFQFKTYTPDITSKEKRSKKIQRVRLSVQGLLSSKILIIIYLATLFNVARGTLEGNIMDQKEEVQEEEKPNLSSDDLLTVHRRISSENIASKQKKFEKLKTLAKSNFVFYL